MCGDRELVKERVLERAVYIVRLIVGNARSHEVSIRLRTLIKYAYTSYILKEDRFNYIKGMASKVKVPRYLFHKDFYKAIEEALIENFDAWFTRRGDKRYAIIRVKPLAPVIR